MMLTELSRIDRTIEIKAPPERVFRVLTDPVEKWHPGGVDPNDDYSREPATTVTFTVEPSPGGARLTVAETGFDEISLERRAKVFADNTQGWADVFAAIQKYVDAAR